eukprot:Blabericola_migrator_1__8782@NODE_462_length_8278_cov_282_498843_g361_i0_p6_GENE_NODE_462_length_8278_cov_282_498843_g361_i0NODE_462_length_8278_cov_282_498843_g361_i0_p6_ORF_typecomplete_len123_score16_53Wzy_C_2/PF11846_8/0_0034Abhydrolase_9_N/PF15420_6/0_008DUF4203/PF13886_6/0_018DUF4131/PF13567_6/0_086_NODE_462_length_8278_cov_282_498843_g361_i046805048
MLPTALASLTSQTLCAAIALPVAAIVTAGTGLGLAIGHVIDHYVDPLPPPPARFGWIILAGLAALAGVAAVSWDYFTFARGESPRGSRQPHPQAVSYHTAAKYHPQDVPDYTRHADYERTSP